MQVKSSSSQNQADIYTFICIISFAILAFLTANLPSGMEALYIIIPMFIVGLVHLVLGPMALIAALSTGKHRRNSWVYLYFGGLILFLTLISGLSNAMYQRARAENSRDGSTANRSSSLMQFPAMLTKKSAMCWQPVPMLHSALHGCATIGIIRRCSMHCEAEVTTPSTFYSKPAQMST